jgi:hypothetical protein
MKTELLNSLPKGLNVKPLKIYVASSFKYKKQCDALYYALTDCGHKIPDIWWNLDSKQEDETDNYWYNKPETKAISARHFKSIRECDILLLVCPVTTPGVFNGANIEVGYALALGKPVYSFGYIGRSAMYSDVIRCYTMEALINCLNIQGLSER